MSKIFEIYSDTLLSQIETLEEEFKGLIKDINLQEKWSHEKFEEIEIKKCFIRSALRYSENSQILLNILNNEISKNDYFKNFNWFTRFYPMIHLINDKSEQGNLHYDQGDDNKMYTCWLPLTKNDYKTISVFKYENLLTNYLKKFIVRLNFFEKLTYPKISNQGQVLIWSGNRIHKGNFNTSDKISCALQMKISINPFLTEATNNKERLLISKSELNSKKKINFIFLYNNFEDLINRLNLIETLNKSFDEINKDVIDAIHKFNSNDDQIISFALSVLSQRIQSYSKVSGSIYMKKLNLKTYVYDLASILIGSENLISLKRIDSKYSIKNIFSNNSLLDQYKFLNNCPTTTYQWKYLLGVNTREKDKIIGF